MAATGDAVVDRAQGRSVLVSLARGVVAAGPDARATCDARVGHGGATCRHLHLHAPRSADPVAPRRRPAATRRARHSDARLEPACGGPAARTAAAGEPGEGCPPGRDAGLHRRNRADRRRRLAHPRALGAGVEARARRGLRCRAAQRRGPSHPTMDHAASYDDEDEPRNHSGSGVRSGAGAARRRPGPGSGSSAADSHSLARGGRHAERPVVDSCGC